MGILMSPRSIRDVTVAQLAQDADFEEVFIDSTLVRAYQHAAGAPKKVTKRSGDPAAD